MDILNLKQFILESKEKEDKFVEDFSEYSDDINTYFSFKGINNLTANKNIHAPTPVGIYCYKFKTADAKYDILKNKSFKKVPFSFHEKSINLFELPWDVKLIAKSYSESDFETDKDILLKKYSDKIEDKDQLLKDTYVQHNNERIWKLTEAIANLFPDPSRKWTSIIKEDLRYDGFQDTFGTGFISPKEKFITILVNKSDVKFIKKVNI